MSIKLILYAYHNYVESRKLNSGIELTAETSRYNKAMEHFVI